MITETQPLAEVTARAIKVLCKEIGVVNAVRFVGQFTAGYGDYTEERKQLLAGLTLDNILSEIKQKRNQTHH
jgi:hypothetical protein